MDKLITISATRCLLSFYTIFFSKWLLRDVILIEQNFWEFERYEIVCEQFSLNLAFEMYVTPVERLKLNL